MMHHPKHSASTQRGYVLVTALIFMVVLTLIAVVATKSTTLELKMSRNYLDKSSTFEASETARLRMNDVIDAVVFSRGWPESQGGSVADSDFGTLPDGIKLLKQDGSDFADSSNPPWDPSSGNQTSYDITDSTWDYPNTIQYQWSPTGSASADGTYDDNGDVNALIAIYKLGVANSPGSGAAMISGYEGTGKGAAGGGASAYFFLRSQGLLGSFDPASVMNPNDASAVAYTGAVYRASIRN